MRQSQVAEHEIVRSPSPESEFFRWVNGFTLALLTAAGFFLRLSHLTQKPYWFDECFSVEVARLDWGNFLRVLWWREANMALYYLLLRLWLHLGHSEFFVRSFSVGISAATIPAVYWVASQLYSRRIGLIAASLFTFNGFSVRYAQEARSYSLFLLLATLSCGFFFASISRSSRRFRVGWVLTSILAVYAHLYALLLVVAQWLFVFWLSKYPDIKLLHAQEGQQLRRSWKIIGVTSLPLLIFVIKTGAGPIRWIHRPGFHDLLIFWQQFCGSSGWLLASAYAIACIAGAIWAWRGFDSSTKDEALWPTRFLLVWLLFPIVLTVLLSFARPVFLPRYMIFCLPALVTMAAAGIDRVRQSWLIAAVLAGFLLLGLQGVFWVYGHDYDDQRDGMGAATDFILDHSRPGDGIIFDIAEARVPYEFFRSERAGQDTASALFQAQLGPEILFPHDGPRLDFRDFKAKITPALLAGAAPEHDRIWVVLIYNENSDATTTVLTRVLPQWFSQTQSWQFPRAEVRLYSKR